MISREQIETIESDYEDLFEVGGLTLERNKEGARPYASSNDMALYTGMRLAQVSSAYSCDPTSERLADVRVVLRGVDQLVNGLAPGVLARWAFPTENAWNRIGYDPELSLEGDNTFGQRIRANTIHHQPPWVYETRTTRDQLGGILCGLSAAWVLAPELSGRVRNIYQPLWDRLSRETNWSLRDHTGSTGGTSAHRADAANRLVMKAMAYAMGLEGEKPRSCFMRFMPMPTFYYTRRWKAIYSYLLGSLDCLSLLLLKDHHHEIKGVRRWWEAIYKQMAPDENPHFQAINQAFTGEGPSDEAIVNLHRLLDEPYPGNYSWNKDPERWLPEGKTTVGPSLDVLFVWWIGEYYKETR